MRKRKKRISYGLSSTAVDVSKDIKKSDGYPYHDPVLSLLSCNGIKSSASMPSQYIKVGSKMLRSKWDPRLSWSVALWTSFKHPSSRWGEA